jgi:CheY-like chemotaxis protein
MKAMLDGFTLLLVDEDRVFAEVYGRYLSQAGAQVVYAQDAREALAVVKDQDIDGIVSEVLLPGKNGLKLVKDLRALTSTHKTPVLFLTVVEAADVGLYHSLQESLGVGAYIVKQRTTPEEVVRVVADLVGAAA